MDTIIINIIIALVVIAGIGYFLYTKKKKKDQPQQYVPPGVTVTPATGAVADGGRPAAVNRDLNAEESALYAKVNALAARLGRMPTLQEVIMFTGNGQNDKTELLRSWGVTIAATPVPVQGDGPMDPESGFNLIANRRPLRNPLIGGENGTFGPAIVFPFRVEGSYEVAWSPRGGSGMVMAWVSEKPEGPPVPGMSATVIYAAGQLHGVGNGSQLYFNMRLSGVTDSPGVQLEARR